MLSKPLSSNSQKAVVHYSPSVPLMATKQLHWGQLVLKTMMKGSSEACCFSSAGIRCWCSYITVVTVQAFISLSHQYWIRKGSQLSYSSTTQAGLKDSALLGLHFVWENAATKHNMHWGQESYLRLSLEDDSHVKGYKTFTIKVLLLGFST